MDSFLCQLGNCFVLTTKITCLVRAPKTGVNFINFFAPNAFHSCPMPNIYAKKVTQKLALERKSLVYGLNM